jgi:ubiquinone/menaquinone biosynthesis C-methylase UbiE
MESSMTSSFNVYDAAGYEQLMGRWGQKLAPLFIEFEDLANGKKILDVGCGTGSLTFALAKTADVGEPLRFCPRMATRQDPCAIPLLRNQEVSS